MSKEVTEQVRKRVKVTLENIEKPELKIEIIAIEVPYVCNTVTSFKSKEIETYMKQRGWQLADKPTKDTHNANGMELLIGGDYYWTVASGKTHRLGEKNHGDRN